MCEMDPETEKQLAALIMEEAKRLRQQADREGVHAYLAKPTVRGRPNSQFLTATVRGVQQANRMAEVNEMWRLREKELELEQQTHHSKSHIYQRSALSDNSRQNLQDRSYSKCKAYLSPEEVTDYRNGSSSSDKAGSTKMAGCSENDHYYSAKRKRVHEGTVDSGGVVHDSETDTGLRNEGFCDDEIEAFLKSRAKRGRGAVGSRMDEPGPYLKSDGVESSSVMPPELRVKEDWEQRIIGPTMPFSGRHVGSLTGMEKLKNKKSKKKEKKNKSKRHSKMQSDVDNEASLKKSKNNHEKEKKLKKEKRKKEKRKKEKRR